MMEAIMVTDEQIRNACKAFDLAPVGRVPVKYELGFESEDREEWPSDACWELVCTMADGDEFPEAGPLGFAAGHLSPGWQFLRDLCDRVAGNDIGTEWFEAMSYDEAREHLQDEADRLVAMMETPGHVLVCVADLGVDEGTEDAKAHLGDTDGGGPRRVLLDLAEQLLGYAGYLVLREVFAPQIDSKLED
jgi:hypothetical protein